MSIFDQVYTPPLLPPAEREKIHGLCEALARLTASEPVLRNRVQAAEGRMRFDLLVELAQLRAAIARLRAEYDAMYEARRAA